MKKFGTFLLALVMVFGLVACTFETNMSYTFTVETGDKIVVKLNTTDGHSISSNVPFEVSKDGEELVTGIFLTEAMYNDYMDTIDVAYNVTVLDKSTKNGNQYTFVKFEHDDFDEYDYFIFVGGSNTGIALGCVTSREDAEDCFNHLTISLAS